MRPNSLQRKMALLLHLGEKEGLFPTETGVRNRKSEELNASRNSFLNWLGGQEPRKSLLAEVSTGVAKIAEDRNPGRTVERPESFLADVGVMKLGFLLGFSRSECRQAIDQHISSVMATFSIFNVDEGSARSTWNELGGPGGGHYLAYRMETTDIAAEHTDRARNLMVIPISVRHTLLGNKRMSKGYQKIRAKAHVYSFTGKSDLYEYDGYITRKDGAGFYHWLFQSRNQTADDLMYIMTGDIERVSSNNPEDAPPRLFLLGSLHTRNQDRNALSGAWPVVIERVDLRTHLGFGPGASRSEQAPDDWGEFDDHDSYFMRTSPKLVDPDSVDSVLRAQMLRANGRASLSLFEFGRT